MKKLISKVIVAALIVGLGTMVSCFKEEAIEPNATFTTNLTDNTAYAGQSFYMYLDQAQGEFLTLFPGTSETKTFSEEDGTRSGTTISTSLDSFEVTVYNNLGEFPMTLVASSVGEFGEEYLQDVYTIDLTVKDARTGFVSFQINRVEGTYSEDGTEILFFAHDNTDLSGIKPIFIPASSNAVVTVDGVEQQSGKTEHDFTPDTPGTGESKTITYTVTAANGDTQEYDVKFILREAKSEKQLLSLTAVGWGGTKFVLSAAEQSAREVKLFYNSGSGLEDVKMQADALGEYVYATDEDGEQVDILPDDERIDVLNYPVVTVVAEDGSTQDYDLLLYERESIDTVVFVEAGGMPLNPTVTATIVDNSISATFIEGTDLTTLVADIRGLTSATVELNGTELESGVTAADYSGSPAYKVVAADGTVINSYTLNISLVGDGEE